jgi:LysM repeat protein
MGDFLGTLKQKAGPFPIWVWAGLGTVLLALVLMRKKAKAGNTAKAASDQTNSDLGTASQLANMFTVAGLMPYQGGDVYINTTETNNPSGPKLPPWQPPGHHKPPTGGGGKPPGKPPTGTPKPRATYVVKRGDTLSKIAKNYGTTWPMLFKYNTTPGVRSPETIANLKKRGPNLLYANEKILIPPKGYK